MWTKVFIETDMCSFFIHFFKFIRCSFKFIRYWFQFPLHKTVGNIAWDNRKSQLQHYLSKRYIHKYIRLLARQQNTKMKIIRSTIHKDENYQINHYSMQEEAMYTNLLFSVTNKQFLFINVIILFIASGYIFFLYIRKSLL